MGRANRRVRSCCPAGPKRNGGGGGVRGQGRSSPVAAAVRQIVPQVRAVDRHRLAVGEHAHVVPHHLGIAEALHANARTTADSQSWRRECSVSERGPCGTSATAARQPAGGAGRGTHGHSRARHACMHAAQRSRRRRHQRGVLQARWSVGGDITSQRTGQPWARDSRTKSSKLRPIGALNSGLPEMES
jgi:hypothetical protein